MGDDDSVLESARLLAVRLKVVAFAPALRGQRVEGYAAVGGRIVSVSGKLGSFRAKAAGGSSDSVDVGGFSPNLDGSYDMILDLGGVPLLPVASAPMGYFAPRTTDSLAAALAALPRLVGKFEDPRPGGVRIRSTGCTGCEACANVCPTGALSAERGTSLRLAFRPAACVHCGRCRSACPEQVLAVTSPASSAQPAPAQVLVEVRMPTCNACGAVLRTPSVAGIAASTTLGSIAVRGKPSPQLCASCRAQALFVN